jgi:voltage-gated potassium channel
MARFRLSKDHRLRSAIALVAVLGLYFALPVSSDSSTTRIVSQIVIAVGCLALAGAVIYREFRRMTLGEALHLTGLQLLIVLEVVMVLFALTYFSLAIHGDQQMDGIRTRMDALYFSATTITTVGYGDVHAAGQLARVIVTVQLVFDVVFIGAFLRLITATGRVRLPDDEPPPQ